MRRPIFLLDDDAGVRDSVRALLEANGFPVTAHGSATTFLAEEAVERGACLIADIRMPGMDGLQLQEELIRRKCLIPIIIMTGHGDVAQAVRAMKAGAVDFIEKPFEADILLASVQRALEHGTKVRTRADEVASAARHVGLLTPREKEVFRQLVLGRSNKAAALELGISARTLEIHRAHIMQKTESRSLSDLVRMSVALNGI